MGDTMFILEFPQNIIGYLGFVVLTQIKKCPYKMYQDACVVYVAGVWGAITLSKYIFADDNSYDSDMVRHEYGHRIQSRMLMVFYLPVIGIPSLIWAGFFKRYRNKHHKSYFWFYTEAWANKLADLDLL